MGGVCQGQQSQLPFGLTDDAWYGGCLKASSSKALQSSPPVPEIVIDAVDQLNMQVNTAFLLKLVELDSLQLKHTQGNTKTYNMVVEVAETNCANDGQHKASDVDCRHKKDSNPQFFRMEASEQPSKDSGAATYSLQQAESVQSSLPTVNL